MVEVKYEQPKVCGDITEWLNYLILYLSAFILLVSIIIIIIYNNQGRL